MKFSPLPRLFCDSFFRASMNSIAFCAALELLSLVAEVFFPALAAPFAVEYSSDSSEQKKLPFRPWNRSFCRGQRVDGIFIYGQHNVCSKKRADASRAAALLSRLRRTKNTSRQRMSARREEKKEKPKQKEPQSGARGSQSLGKEYQFSFNAFSVYSISDTLSARPVSPVMLLGNSCGSK